jgi:glutamate-1-semialdehyde aminotransferase
MGKNVKFASQIDETALAELKAYARQSNRSISGVLTEAVEAYLGKVRIRPAFEDAAAAVLEENDELLRRLAK